MLRFPKFVLPALVALAFLPAAAEAHPGHHHPGLPGATPLWSAPFPMAGPSAGGYSSGNVEYVTNFPQHFDSAGGRKLGKYFYITTERDLTIYDTTEPEDPQQVGHLLLPEFGQPVFTEEDPDTNGRILLVSNGGVLMVIDVSDKSSPEILSTIEDPNADQHTITCVLDCTWAYGSEGAIIDLRDPAKPRLSPNNWQTGDIESEHDVTEVEPGVLLTSTQPLKLIDARTDPENPTVIGTTALEAGRFTHANLWPRDGKDDFLLVGGEAVGPGCAADVSATFSTWDARELRETGVAKEIDKFLIEPGVPTEGRAPDSSFCVHWFNEHPNFENGGLVAISWYEHGTHFLKIGKDGSISEVGWFLGGGGQASGAYWIDDRTVYVADYIRGLDVLRFTGDVGTPPSTPFTDGAGPLPEPQSQTQSPAQTTETPPPAQAPQPPAQTTTPPANAACVKSPGFRSTGVKPRGRGLDLAFDRTSDAPVIVDVFQQSVGRRVVGERLVARFTGRTGDVAWDGKATVPGRRVTDGFYFVRYRTSTPNGTDTPRIALRRAKGRWSARPSFYRRAECDLVRSFKLERPVFGGRANRGLGISYRLERPADVAVTVLRGKRVVKRFAAQAADARRTYRLRLAAKGLPRGDYRVRLEATRAGERVRATAISRRL